MIAFSLLFLRARLVGALVFIALVPALRADVLDDYVQRLRRDAAGERRETGFMSPGSDFLYGQDYFDAGNYSSAVWYFRDAARKATDNPFFRYQLGVALLKTGDENVRDEARQHVDAAIQLQPELRRRFAREFAVAADDATAANGTPAPGDPAPPANQPRPPAAASVQEYIARLKRSRAVGGAETAMNAPGQSALYGIEHFERDEFDSAETNFRLALARDAANPHLHYLLAIALAAQGKDAAAAPHLERAVASDATLRAQFEREIGRARTAWQAKLEDKKPRTTPAAPETAPGGELVFGDYTCHETIWNGPNRVPAFRSEYRGYFELKADGTYRWLDNGETGRYRYNARTGVVTWLSGRFAGGGAPQSTVYRREGRSGAMTISFSENLRWNAFREVK